MRLSPLRRFFPIRLNTLRSGLLPSGCSFSDLFVCAMSEVLCYLSRTVKCLRCSPTCTVMCLQAYVGSSVGLVLQ